MNRLKRFVWIGLATVVVAAATTASGAEVTDKFRWSPMSVHPFFSGNYTKDPITLCPWNLRAEFSGQGWHHFKGINVQSYNFILSLGLVEGLEIGALMPLNVVDQNTPGVQQGSNKSIGDVGAYGKYRFLDTDMWDLAAGFEYAAPRQQDPQLTLSNGTIIEARNGFTVPSGLSITKVRNGALCGTGDVCALGFSEGSYEPFASVRATFGEFSTGGHLGYMFYDDPLGQMVNWDINGIWAPLDFMALRLELTGFNQTKGASQDIIALSPGIDFVFDRLTFRIGGVKGITDDAADWALGGGVAVTLGEECDEEPPPPPPPPAAPAAAPPPAPVKKKIVLRGVNFDFDKSNIRPVDVPVLEEAVRTLKEEGMPSVIAIGYTDSVGTDAYNQRLSERRANSVKQWLSAHGIPAEKITAEGRGETDPVASNETADGRAQNRRTELKVVE